MFKLFGRRKKQEELKLGPDGVPLLDGGTNAPPPPRESFPLAPPGGAPNMPPPAAPGIFPQKEEDDSDSDSSSSSSSSSDDDSTASGDNSDAPDFPMVPKEPLDDVPPVVPAKTPRVPERLPKEIIPDVPPPVSPKKKRKKKNKGKRSPAQETQVVEEKRVTEMQQLSKPVENMDQMVPALKLEGVNGQGGAFVRSEKIEERMMVRPKYNMYGEPLASKAFVVPDSPFLMKKPGKKGALPASDDANLPAPPPKKKQLAAVEVPDQQQPKKGKIRKRRKKSRVRRQKKDDDNKQSLVESGYSSSNQMLNEGLEPMDDSVTSKVARIDKKIERARRNLQKDIDEQQRENLYEFIGQLERRRDKLLRGKI